MRLPLFILTIAVALPGIGPVQAQQPPANPTTAPPRPTMLKPQDIPAGDGSQPRQRLVTVFGSETCPKPSDPNLSCARSVMHCAAR